ncbi:hypothetical protein DFR86_00955 [Acidianus sulfidivorans JP7]|uniref:Thermopsin n=1 Tax=Acidianus sulfidivorans JP7 TaxID=619593 RepID=A0A2U9IJQ8_9CREN|nr:hypothetical protein [Acidianus sulfidivorans]AWR96250.1 hypothetical protein DFR86_00955 [Acidianus sulfidivorans JP7]
MLNESRKLVYQGYPGGLAIDKVNLINVGELIIFFKGEILGTFSYNPGIVLYSGNTSLNQPGTYDIAFDWAGSLFVYKLTGSNPVMSLPFFSSGTYEIILKNVNSSVYVYEVIINNKTYFINYNTGVPWNSIGYVGIRPDTDTVLPLSFVVEGFVGNLTYNVYLNGKFYHSGIANGLVTLSLRVFSPAVVNITFPQYHLYKVITISPSGESNIREEFPTLQVSLLTITGVIIGVSVWREIAKKYAS